jgi:hypothetical protein
LIHNAENWPGKEYIEKLLDAAGSEPDPPLNTARIAGVVTGKAGEVPVFIVGIKAFSQPGRAWQIDPAPGTIAGISTYRGDIEKPEPPDPGSEPPRLKFDGKNAGDLAQFLFDISTASYKGEDIRVCTLGGVRSGKKWDIGIKNVLTA